eukprot:4249290-Pleurochrysis_carterae.AAC.2
MSGRHHPAALHPCSRGPEPSASLPTSLSQSLPLSHPSDLPLSQPARFLALPSARAFLSASAAALRHTALQSPHARDTCVIPGRGDLTHL